MPRYTDAPSVTRFYRLSNSTRQSHQIELLVSVPTLIEGYLVSAVLSVETDVLNSYHRLASAEVSIHEYRKKPVARSLIDAAIDELSISIWGTPQTRSRTRKRGRGLRDNSLSRPSSCQQRGLSHQPHALDADYFFYDACDKISLLR